jgi:hypothetical protein
VRSVKEERLDRTIRNGERHFRTAITECVEHYQGERNQQEVDNQLILGSASDGGNEPRATPFPPCRLRNLYPRAARTSGRLED